MLSESSDEGEDEVTKEEEQTEEDLDYESNSSYQILVVGQEVTTLVPIDEEDEVRCIISHSFLMVNNASFQSTSVPEECQGHSSPRRSRGS